MKGFILITLISSMLLLNVEAQPLSYDYTVSTENPYGKLNPEAPKEVGDYASLIGTCDCDSYVRKKDQTWADPMKIQWTFKYINNGTAIQDETLKPDGSHGGSLRQYNVDSARWYVHYYSSKVATPVLSTWEGGMKDGEIILLRSQKAPNGMDGFYKIRFYDISQEGFNWVGAWINATETFSLETWRIECRKRS